MRHETPWLPRAVDGDIMMPLGQGAIDGVQADDTHRASVWSPVLLALFFLIVAHLCVKTFFPNPAFWFMGAAMIVGVGVRYVSRRGTFGFLLAIYVCVHFTFADQQGGLWSYVLCATTLVTVLLKYRPEVRLSSVPPWFNLLIFIFLGHQLFGTLLNPYSAVANIQSSVVAVAQIIAFYYCASISWNKSRMRELLFAAFLVACWAFVMGLNQKNHWLMTPSPLLPQRATPDGEIVTIAAGSFANSELFGEYFCIMFIFSETVAALQSTVLSCFSVFTASAPM